MLGLGLSQVKLEPTSEDDDISQLSCNYYSDPLPPYDIRPLKLDTESLRPDDVQNNLLQLQELQVANGLEELSLVAPAGPAATPVCVKQEPSDAPPPPATFETLETPANPGPSLMERQMTMLSHSEEMSEFVPLMPVKEEPNSEGESNQHSEDTFDPPCEYPSRGHKSWTQEDMDAALNALKTQNMSLTKASARFGIPSTTLWQRAHRAGIDTPKREHAARAWTPRDLSTALAQLRLGRLSANKASKAYGIPSSTLYKIARREGIRLSAPFNAAPTSWRRADLSRALDAIRAGDSVQRAATHYRIPTGTLYGRCKREGIELSRSNPTPWSEDAMREALEAVRIGQMSINQAAIHYNLPYSSLYGRFKRCKYQIQNTQAIHQNNAQEMQELEPQVHQDLYYQQQMPQDSSYLQYDAHNTLMHNNMTVDDQTYPEQVMYYARGDGVVS